MAASPRLRWGLLGSGGICNDFAAGVVTSGGHIAAIGASSLSKAQALADKVQPEAKAYGSYEELVIDPNVDVVYVGTIHTLHLPHTKMALLAGKPVICEKPLAVNQREAEEMIDLARSKGLFLMEAMWTRFFPIYRKLREILEGGKDIGIPRCVQADFGFVVDLTDPNHRLLDPSLAGGAMLDIGIYLVQLATMIFGNVEPEMKCTAILSNENVDQEGSLSLTWKDKGSASLLFTLRATTPENTVIMGDQGFLRIHGPAHSPTRMTVSKKAPGSERGKFVEEEFNFPLPKLKAGLSVNYPASEGMLYQVLAAEKCIQEGQLECSEYTLDESLAVMKIMDSYRQQVGVIYPFETSSCSVS